MSNRASVILCCVLCAPGLAAAVYGIRYQILHGQADMDRAKAEYDAKKERDRKEKIFESCKTSVRWAVRDVLRGSPEIRIGANFWNGDERVVVVAGFARTATEDVQINAEFSKCASGYQMAVYTIGSTTRVRDEIEHERIKGIMRK